MHDPHKHEISVYVIIPSALDADRPRIVPTISFQTGLEDAQLITLAEPLGHHMETANDVIEIGPGLQVRKRMRQTLHYNLDVTRLRGFEDGKLHRFECGPSKPAGEDYWHRGVHLWNPGSRSTQGVNVSSPGQPLEAKVLVQCSFSGTTFVAKGPCSEAPPVPVRDYHTS